MKRRSEPAQPLQVAALRLHGAPAGLGPWLQAFTARGNHGGATFAALFALGVEPACGVRGTALFAQYAHRDRPLVLADADREPVADLQRFCSLDTRVVELDLPAFDRMRRECPRLEESCGPKPLVDSHVCCRAFHIP